MKQFRQLFDKHLIFIAMIIYLFSCSAEPNVSENDFKSNEIRPNDTTTRSLLSIVSQLSQVLDTGDFFILDEGVTNDDALIFSSVHEFVLFKNDHYLNLDPSTIIESEGYYLTRFLDIYNLTMGIEIIVSQKLDDEDSKIDYFIKDLESRLKGNSFAREWEQAYYEYEIFNGTAIIDLKGTLQYELLIENYGIVFYDTKVYKMIIDIHTSTPISFEDF